MTFDKKAYDKAYNKERYKKPECKQAIIESNARHLARKMEWFRGLKKDLCCVQCGETHEATLDFHHSNPDEKEFNVSQALTTKGKKRIILEMEKCIVLCSNCHRKLHHELRQLEQNKDS